MADAAPIVMTRRQLEADHPEIIQAIIRDEVASYEKTVKEMTGRAEAAEEQVKTLTTEKTTLEGKVTEMTKAHGEQKGRADKAEGEVKEMKTAARIVAVRDAAIKVVDDRIETAKKGKDCVKEAAVLEMAKKGLPALIDASVLSSTDDDKNTLSVNAAMAKFDAKVADVREMAKHFGGPIQRDVSEVAKKGTVATGGEDEAKQMQSLFPSLAKQAAQKAKEAEGAKK